MVVRNLSDVKINMAEQQQQPLKFGMDRILSEEASTSKRKEESPCTTAPPCAGCISSLYRCCRISPTSTSIPSLYRNGIHAPQPLRPYTNVLIQADSSIQTNPPPTNPSGGNAKRKRSWSRAVFSNLQRKGLEKRFQLQKYITKPDRRQLAATLGLTDAQVKVWFQNRRMKWRHTKESTRQNSLQDGRSENVISADSTQEQHSDSECGSDIDVQTIDT